MVSIFKTFLILILVPLFGHASPDSLVGTESCESLLSQKVNFASDKPPQVPEGLKSREDIAAWIGRNFLGMLKKSDLQSGYHAQRVTHLMADLKEAKLRLAPPTVAVAGYNQYIVSLVFRRPNPRHRELAYQVTARVILALASDDLSKALSISNTEIKLDGIVGPDFDPIASAARYNAMLGAYVDSEYRHMGFILDPTHGSKWIDHLRFVLETLVVPLALRDPTIAEVGIGFSPEIMAFENGKMGGIPRLFIIRSTDTRSRIPAPSMLLDARNLPRVTLAGVEPEFDYLSLHDLENTDPYVRRDHMVVFDEMRDKNPEGSIYALHRATGVRSELAYDPKYRKITWAANRDESAPEADVAPFVASKVNSLLLARLKNLFERGGDNQRIKVKVMSTDGVLSTNIYSLRQIAEMTKDTKIRSISESWNDQG